MVENMYIYIIIAIQVGLLNIIIHLNNVIL